VRAGDADVYRLFHAERAFVVNRSKCREYAAPRIVADAYLSQISVVDQVQTVVVDAVRGKFRA